MKKPTFIRLNRRIKIIKRNHFCILLDTRAGNTHYLSNLEAFLLSLADGGLKIKDTEIVIHRAFGYGLESVKSFVKRTLEKYREYLDFSPSPLEKDARYHPKEFLKKDGLLLSEPSDRLLPLEFPTEMTMSLTNKCNFRCVYCFKSSGQNLQNELTTKEWLEVIEQAKEINVVRCNVTGGEPMLHPGFFACVKRLIKLDIFPYISTNASLITVSDVKRLKATGLKFIQISLDSANADTHDKMTGTRGSFKSVVNGIRALVKEKFWVRIKSVVTPYNYIDIEKLLDFCGELGVREITLDQFSPAYGGRGNRKLLLLDDMVDFIDEIISGKKASLPNLTVVSALKSLLWKDANDITFCGGLLSAFSVQPNGDVGVCEQLVDIDELKIGNIRQQRLKDLWGSPRAIEILNPPPEKISQPCISCEHLKKCRTGCPAHKLLYSDNYLAPDPKCWKAAIDDNPFISIPSAV